MKKMKDKLICVRLSQEDYDQLEENIAGEQERIQPHKIKKTDYYRDRLLSINANKEVRIARYTLKKIQLELRHTNLLLQKNMIDNETFQKELESLFVDLQTIEKLLEK